MFVLERVHMRGREEKRDERDQCEIGIRRTRDSHKYMHKYRIVYRSMHADTNTYVAETKRVSVHASERETEEHRKSGVL